MGLLDEVEAETRYGGSACSVRVVLDAMKPKERAEWEDVLASDAQHSAISRVAARHGLGLSKGALQRHRNGDCRCPR